jgi:hypothetical protein
VVMDADPPRVARHERARGGGLRRANNKIITLFACARRNRNIIDKATCHGYKKMVAALEGNGDQEGFVMTETITKLLGKAINGIHTARRARSKA